MTLALSRRRTILLVGTLVGGGAVAFEYGSPDDGDESDVDEFPAPADAVRAGELWDFRPPWPDWPISPSGEWQVAGPWHGTGGTWFHPDHAALVESYGGEDRGYLLLTIPGTGPDGDPEGAELEAVGSGEDGYTDRYGRGYYETRMKVPTGPGVYSFYWIERTGAGGYGPSEIDIEFVTAGTKGNADRWADGEGYVWYALHPDGGLHEQSLGFDPSAEFHRYGFLWTQDRVTWTVDGEPVYTDRDTPIQRSDDGTIMMNAWVGDGGWGGATPPDEDTTVAYDYVWYVPGATEVPSNGPVR